MSSVDSIAQSFEEWLQRGEVRLRDLISATDEHWREYFSREIDQISQEVDDAPERAYAHLLSLVGFAGSNSGKSPRIVKILGEYVRKLADIMGKIAKALGASSFSIIVSVPFDLSIDLTFS